MTDYEKFRILVDMPAGKPGLGFDRTAVGLASLIRRSEPQFAIAIYGPWGSGKTTLMNAIRARVVGTRAIAVDFSAWRYEKEEHLIVPLLDTIRAALLDWVVSMEARSEAAGGADSQGATRHKDLVKVGRDTARTVGRVIASLLAGMSFKVGIPGALDISYDANKALSRAASSPGGDQTPRHTSASVRDTFSQRLSDPELPQSVYHACFRALTEAFQEFARVTRGARIVVFVDDLDRCLPAGTIQVLESMKLFFDLRGFVFVVGLDHDVVVRCIESRYQVDGPEQPGSSESARGQRLVRGTEYLKKIFQVPYSLAPVSLGLLGDLFQSLKRDSRLSPVQMSDMENVVLRHLAYLFSGLRVNPREVKRYINAYIIQMKVKPSLDPDIVLALNTVDFRQDCRNLSDAIATFREEATTVLRAFLDEGDSEFLEDVGLTTADIPEDIRDYLAGGGSGRGLLEEPDLGGYLDAGAATRSTTGGYFLDLLAEFRKFRIAIRQAINASEPIDFDAAWTMANSHFHSLVERLPQLNPEIPSSPAIERAWEWLDAGASDKKWQVLLNNLGTIGVDEAGGEEAVRTSRADALMEAQVHLASLQALLRERRRQASFELM
ncbi:MAG: P-loop NTPase fold protein [Aquisalimonadaceae bacterium]